MLLAVWLLNFNTRFQDSQNVYVNELQANGLYKFYDAFVKNELNYKQFYITEPEEQAEAFVHGIYGSTGDNLHAVRCEGPEIRRNIVLVTAREHECFVHGAFRQHEPSDARTRLALQAGTRLRPRIRDRPTARCADWKP